MRVRPPQEFILRIQNAICSVGFPFEKPPVGADGRHSHPTDGKHLTEASERGLTWAVGTPRHLKVYPLGVQLIWPVAGRGGQSHHATASTMPALSNTPRRCAA